MRPSSRRAPSRATGRSSTRARSTTTAPSISSPAVCARATPVIRGGRAAVSPLHLGRSRVHLRGRHRLQVPAGARARLGHGCQQLRGPSRSDDPERRRRSRDDDVYEPARPEVRTAVADRHPPARLRRRALRAQPHLRPRDRAPTAGRTRTRSSSTCATTGSR